MRLWEENIQEATFDAAARAVSLFYDSCVRKYVPGNPAFSPQAVSRHFTTHGTHRLTRLVMQMHITTAAHLQMLETMIEKDASGRTIPITDKKANALAKLVGAQMVALNALHRGTQ